mgnify:FL=1|tara:strand:- start:147 stop:323 length:177 start_codon:yes stop_codon:yes gene_type:complete
MSKNLDVSYKATSNEEMLENTQRQKSILEILLSKNEADYYYKKAEEKKKKIKANPLFS